MSPYLDVGGGGAYIGDPAAVAPWPHGGWSRKFFDTDVMGGTYDRLAKSSDALLQGRRTYQVSASVWPNRSGDSFSD